MNPREPHSRHVSAPAPVNLRTAQTAVDAAAPLPPPMYGSLALSRRRRSAARALLGTPLADRIQAAGLARRRAANALPLPQASIALALLTTAASSGLVVLGALQSSTAWLIVGAMGLFGAAAGGSIRWWRRRALHATTTQGTSLAFDADTLRRLDDLLETIAPELLAKPCAQLVDLKDRFTRMAGMLGRADANDHSTTEDRMYLVEAVRRYLPDTLLAYLAVPPTQRHDRLLDGSTASELLASQLTLLQSELQLREDRLATASGAALLRQQRFLRSKVESREG